MKSARTKWLLACSPVLLVACQSAGLAVPARLGADRMSSACIVQMQNFITTKEGLGTVLTATAFATGSALSIAEAPSFDAKGNLRQGRERNMPAVYFLSKGAAGCTITRERDGSSALLDKCSCVPLG